MNVGARLPLSFALLSGTLALAAEPSAVAEKKSLTLEGAKQVAAAAAAEARGHSEGGAMQSSTTAATSFTSSASTGRFLPVR